MAPENRHCQPVRIPARFSTITRRIRVSHDTETNSHYGRRKVPENRETEKPATPIFVSTGQLFKSGLFSRCARAAAQNALDAPLMHVTVPLSLVTELNKYIYIVQLLFGFSFFEARPRRPTRKGLILCRDSAAKLKLRFTTMQFMRRVQLSFVLLVLLLLF